MTDAGQMGREAAQKGREVERSDTLDHLVRAGMVAYGVVHLLIAFLAIQLALGERSGEASAQGAMQELASQPFGRAMVWAVAIGMVLLVLWRIIEAVFGHRDEEGGTRTRKRLVSAGKALVYGALAVTAIRVAVGSGGSGGSGSKTMTSRLMSAPGGQWLVVAVGLAVIAYAANLAYRGWTEKFAEHLEIEACSAPAELRTSSSGRSATSPRGSRSPSSADCSATPGSPTTRPSPVAASTRR